MSGSSAHRMSSEKMKKKFVVNNSFKVVPFVFMYKM